MHIRKLLTFSKYYARKKYIKDIQLFFNKKSITTKFADGLNHRAQFRIARYATSLVFKFYAYTLLHLPCSITYDCRCYTAWHFISIREENLTDRLTYRRIYINLKYKSSFQNEMIVTRTKIYMNVSNCRNKNIMISSSSEHLTRMRRNYFNSYIVTPFLYFKQMLQW